MKKTLAFTAALCAGSLSLIGCADSTETGTAADETTSVAADTTSAGAIELVDGYCRAKPAADDEAAMEDATDLDKKHSDMTACFGTLQNASDKDITVTSFKALSLDGASTELHEVVDGVMQEKPGGFTIAPGDTYDLVPGGDHLMIMNYAGAIPAGENLQIELTTDGGETLSIELPVREQPSGEENYGGNQDDMAGHDH